MLTIVIIRGVTLPGADVGLTFYMKPNFTLLADASIWVDAAGQVFYSMGLGVGCLTALASYNHFNHKLVRFSFDRVHWLIQYNVQGRIPFTVAVTCLGVYFRDIFAIPFADGLTSIYAGLAIFSMLGYMAQMKNVPVSEVVDQGRLTTAGWIL